MNELDPAAAAVAIRRRRGTLALDRAPAPAAVPACLLAEAFAVTLAVIAVFWLGWVLLWLLEQRW